MRSKIEQILDNLRGYQFPGLCTSEAALSWDQWRDDVARLRKEHESLAQSSVGILFRPTVISYGMLAALSMLDCHVYLFDAALESQRVDEISQRHGLYSIIDTSGGEGSGPVAVRRLDGKRTSDVSVRGGITLFTSGSTGLPKAVHHDWDTLTRPVRIGISTPPQTWLLTYRPQLYAGIQVFLHCLLNRCTLVIPGVQTPVEELIPLMCCYRVGYVSATPSYWRHLITHGSRVGLASLELQQITLGGEVSDQALLDELARLFPAARIVHIYATSELGRCFSVKDRHAGFPASYLEGQTEEGVSLKVEDGELHVKSVNARLRDEGSEDAAGRGCEWIATGDLVERSGDRYYFVGRRCEIINVGGNKVHPVRVEQVLREISGVMDVRVFGRASSMVGQMVACQFVVERGFDPETVKLEMIRKCRDHLSAHERPRFLEAVQMIQLSDAGKKIRQMDSCPAP
jgi:acyl-CoA synthetase (AMP-forming)/AMP-acid ligase II